MRWMITLIAVAVLSLPLTLRAQEPPVVPAEPAAVEPAKPAESKEAQVSKHLQDISVTIVSKTAMGGGEGSGVVVTRKFPNGETVNFVWTAAHCVDNLRRTKEIIDGASGTRKTVVEFDDSTVVKSLGEDGRAVGKIEFFAEVVRFSAEEDLALLRLRKKNFLETTVTFALDEEIPPIGTKLLHVGSKMAV